MSEQHDPKTGKFLPGHTPTPGGGRPAGTRNRLEKVRAELTKLGEKL
jgi:hypothetical protein